VSLVLGLPLAHASPGPADAGAAAAAARDARPAVQVGPVVPWSWPVAPPHPVLRPFQAPEHRWSPGHRGIDVGAPVGAAVTAPDDGVVHFAGTVVDRPVLSMRHADGVLSSLEPVATTLHVGEAVTRGQVVAELVAGHDCPSECVHLGARIDGEYVSPLMMLGEGRPSVLLPTRRDVSLAPGGRRGTAASRAEGAADRLPRRRAQARGWAVR